MIKEYYENDISKGIMYDWDLIEREYKKLGIPKEYYYPNFKVLKRDDTKWHVLLSERKVGKTTDILLLGLIIYKLYESPIIYVRPRDEELNANISQELTTVIRSYKDGEYIKKLTNNRYNTMIYKWKAIHYARVNSDGEIEEIAQDFCIKFLSIDKHDIYKSTLNIPQGDIIIVDEFLRDYYPPNEFINLCDLKDTIGRYRQSVNIFMLANTINTEHKYFEELEIYKKLKNMQVGESCVTSTSLGTNIYVELIKSGIDKKTKNVLNKLYYGFKNPKLSAITGGVNVWNFENYPHIFTWNDEENTKTIISNNLYIETSTKQLLRLELVEYKERIFYEVYRGKNLKDDSIVLTLDTNCIDSNRYFGLGIGQLEKMLRYALTNKLFYFATNEVGAMFNAYIKEYKTMY